MEHQMKQSKLSLEELDGLLSLKDWDRICAQLESRGFDRLDKDKTSMDWGLDWDILNEKSAYKEYVVQIDEAAGLRYSGTLYRDNPVYTGCTIVSIMRYPTSNWAPRKDASARIRSAFYIDAPLPDEFLREWNAPVPCDACGCEYAKRTLTRLDKHRVCMKCLFWAFDHDSLDDLMKQLKFVSN